MIAAIPTTYRDIRFRSRLEARWAAFFDGLAAPWSYEPIDLPGWIPDFRIGDALIDVKPAREYPPEVGGKLIAAVQAAGVESVGLPWILAESPLNIASDQRTRLVGWWALDGSPLVIADVVGHGFAFMHQGSRRTYPAFGFPECDPMRAADLRRRRDGHDGLQIDDEGGARIDRLWARACNATQWKRA